MVLFRILKINVFSHLILFTIQYSHIILVQLNIQMINRLVAENTIKCPFRGAPYFTTNKLYLSFLIDSTIRIKSITRELKDIEVTLPQIPLHFQLSQNTSRLLVLYHTHQLQIYSIEYPHGISEGQIRKNGVLENVECFKQIADGLAIISKNKTIKVLTFTEITHQFESILTLDVNEMRSLTQAHGQSKLYCNYQSHRLLISKSPQGGQVVQVYQKLAKGAQFQKNYSLRYLKQVLGIFKDKYVFESRKDNHQIHIYNIQDSKLMGKFPYEGTIRSVQIKDNLMLLITTKQNIDYLTFLVLNPHVTQQKSLIQFKSVYEKGKGDYHAFLNVESTEASQMIEKKKGGQVLWGGIGEVSENTSTILLILNKGKEKIEMLRVDHSKLLKCCYKQEKLDEPVASKRYIDCKEIEENKIEIDRARIHSSIEYKSSQKSLEETQRKFIQQLIDMKLKVVLLKFSQLERRVQGLQRTIKVIYDKMEMNLEKINRQEIRQNVQNMFEKFTPQFQKYFAEIFKQVTGVLDQGVNYYNMKLAKEAEIHKQALTQIVSETFKATEEIVGIAKKQQYITDKTEEHLRKLLDAKRKWTKSTEQFEARTKDVPIMNPRLQNNVEGKIFVRADLNHQVGPRKEH